MNKESTTEEILNSIYAAYGTGSGVLFGIKDSDKNDKRSVATDDAQSTKVDKQ